MFYTLNNNHSDYYKLANISYVLIGISEYLASRFGAARESGSEICVKEALGILGKKSIARLSKGEQTAWQRWSPLVLNLAGVRKWSNAERLLLAEIITCKGREDELVYLKKLNNHKRLKKGILRYIDRFCD